MVLKTCAIHLADPSIFYVLRMLGNSSKKNILVAQNLKIKFVLQTHMCAATAVQGWIILVCSGDASYCFLEPVNNCTPYTMGLHKARLRKHHSGLIQEDKDVAVGLS